MPKTYVFINEQFFILVIVYVIIILKRKDIGLVRRFFVRTHQLVTTWPIKTSIEFKLNLIDSKKKLKLKLNLQEDLWVTKMFFFLNQDSSVG